MQRHGLLAAAALLVVPLAARAQDTDDLLHTRQRAVRNQVGLLGYCQQQGLLNGAAPAAAPLPLPDEPGLGDTEEAMGRKGLLAFNTRPTTLAESAGAQGTSLLARCQLVSLTVAALSR